MVTIDSIPDAAPFVTLRVSFASLTWVAGGVERKNRLSTNSRMVCRVQMMTIKSMMTEEICIFVLLFFGCCGILFRYQKVSVWRVCKVMSVFEYIIGAILILFSLLIILVVLLQEGNESNLGVIAGAADSFMDKGMAKTWDARLAKWTKVIAITFFVLVLAGMLITKFLSPAALAGKSDDSTSTSTTTSETTSDTTSDIAG